MSSSRTKQRFCGFFCDNATITAIQTLTADQVATSVRDLVTQARRALPNSALPQAIQFDAAAALTDLEGLATASNPDTGRIGTGLVKLRGVMEQAAGNVVGAGILALIDQVHSAF